ncbi:MAG: hypothetical protein AAF741_10265 [Bacteroidota bacterium]
MNIEQLHPLPRYGLAAAYLTWRQNREQILDLREVSDVRLLSVYGLKSLLNGMMVKGEPHRTETARGIFRDIGIGELNPGSKNRQSAAYGVYLSPHVLTGQNASGLFGEVGKLIKLLENGKNGNYELKRSFAPGVAKINAGNSSMSNPKVDILEAALTAIGTGTRTKAGAYDYDAGDNVGIIPDLPLEIRQDGQLDGPIWNYVRLLDIMMQNQDEGLRIGKYDATKNSYERPGMFNGNYRFAIPNTRLSSVGLMAAMGHWSQESKSYANEMQQTMESIAARPIYVGGYAGFDQERFSHHIVGLAAHGDLYRALRANWKVEIIGVDSAKKYSNPKWSLFQMHLNRFLQFFNQTHLKNLLSIRAIYPGEYHSIFKHYFMDKEQFSEAFVNSAKAFGRSLNRAAYASAQREKQGEKVDNKTLYDYKSRALNQLESFLRSSETKEEMLARITTVMGRMTGYDLDQEATHFIEEFLTNPDYSLDQGRDLLIIFMRLNQGVKPEKSVEEYDIESENDFVMG